MINLLTEAIQDVLYHYTDVSKLPSILENDTLYFSTTLGGDTDNIIGSTDKLFFVSTTRTKSAKVGYGRNKSSRIVLKRDKLKSKFELSPVDYWGYDQWKNSPNTHNEMEERILSYDESINNVSKFIESIDFLIVESMDYAIIYMYICDKLCRDRNIPIYFYTDRTAFENQNRNKSIKNVKDFYKDIDKEQLEYMSSNKPVAGGRYYGSMIVLLYLLDSDIPVADYVLKLQALTVDELKIDVERYKHYLKSDPTDEHYQKMLINTMQLKSKLESNDGLKRVATDVATKIENRLDSLSHASDFIIHDMTRSFSADIHNSRRSTDKRVKSIVKDIANRIIKSKEKTVFGALKQVRDRIQSQ
jgi:hypothetical protein